MQHWAAVGRAMRAAGLVLVGLLAFAMIAMAVVALPSAIQAARGDGPRGSFTAEQERCSNRGCAHYGTWREASPGDRVVQDVLMDEWPSELPLGASVDAIYLGETDPALVFPSTGSFAFLYVIVAAGGGVILLVGALGAWSKLRADRRFARRSLGYRALRAKSDDESGPDQPGR